MRLSGIAAVVVTLMTVSVPALAQNATTPPGPFVTPPRDSVSYLLRGVWVSDADPNGFVMISTWGSGMVSLDAAGRFSAVGFFDGRELVGLTRTSPRVGAQVGIAGMGILRARYREGREIEVEFAEDLNGATVRREIWKLHRKSGSPTPDAPREAPGESLPGLGEYVYVEELPEAIEKVPPDYPDWARRKNLSGTVLVQALIGKDGRVKDTKIVRSIPDLDDYAVAAVKQWRFKPALSKGSPVAVWVAIPVRFTIN